MTGCGVCGNALNESFAEAFGNADGLRMRAMESRLADFCDVVWQRTLDAAFVAVGIKATSAVAVVSPSVEEMIGLTRLPRLLIEEAVGFAKQHADVCLLSLGDVPSMPVPDPWDAQRQADLETRVRRSIGQMIRLAQKHWGFSTDQAGASQCAASTELLGELASQWEEGRRAYHKALQAGGCGPLRLPTAETEENNGTPRNKSRRKRGKTTEERLRDLMASDGGWQKIRECRTAADVGKLIKRSHSAVVATVAWKREIYPALCAQKSMAKYHRLEQEERRRDRHQTDW